VSDLIPVGGGIDFGETSEQAVRREVKEEINADIQDLKLLGLVENLFTCSGIEGHEIIFIYEANFADQQFFLGKKLRGLSRMVPACQ
jgi:8-oxo-dGTP pyrophosphatase MutT (NUDIX family)